ncbi:MAG: TonB-dependent receptor [Holophagaceae bacterium]|uniref:TonB-dependent receptor n=1 Tax=Candidatus Geothrix skivensis TaxID=2954439 RepID=A0A9D7SF93_9BACT|nr:TonB-dependent receptor [Candidatus Geothrix skivensis]
MPKTRPCSFATLALGALVLYAGPWVRAQTVTTGAVSGTLLSSASGAPLTGLKVRLISAQITRTAITDREGRFMVGLLNPGPWKVSVERPGFQSWYTAVSVATDTDTPLRIRLVEVPEVTIAVSAQVDAALDLTSTAAGTTINETAIAWLPLSRNMSDLVYLAPTATFAGRSLDGGEGVDYSINGASGAENQFILDGLVTNEFKIGGQGLFLVTDFLDQVQVETAGYRPEFGALGGVFNATLKSGANLFAGSTWAVYSAQSSEARAVSNSAGFRQPAPATRWDLGFGVGGPLSKDRIFYYVGADLDHQSRRPYPNNSGLQGGDQTMGNLQAVAKLNAFLTPEKQLSVTFVLSDRTNETPLAVPNGYGDANLGATQKDRTTLLSLAYDWTARPDLLVSLKAGFFRNELATRPEDTARPLINDAFWFNGGGGGLVPELATYEFQRGGYGAYGRLNRNTNQFGATLSWYLGAHTLKAGASSLDANLFKQDFASGPPGENATWGITSDGTEINSSVWGNLTGVWFKARYQAFFVQDTWEVAKGLRVLYGVRAETQEHFDPQGRSVLKFTDLGKYLQPRLGFTWDPVGDGRRKLSGSYGVYYQQLPQHLATTAFGGFTALSIGYALSAYSPVGIGALGAQTWVWNGGAGMDHLPVAEGTQLPRRKEISLGYAQLLRPGLTLRVSGIWRELTHPIDDSTIFDASGQAYMNYLGAPMGILWNPGPTVTWVAREGTTDVNGNDISGQRITVSNTRFPEGYNRYQALTVGLEQQKKRAFWSAAYTWSHLWGNYEGVLVADRGDGPWGVPNIGGLYDAWPYVGTGNLPLDRRHLFKLYGSQRAALAGLDWNLGLRWTWMSGVPINLYDDGSSTQGLPPGTLGPYNPLDPWGFGVMTPERFTYGTRGRTPNTSVVDLRLDTEFKLGGVRLRPSLELFNLFNSRTPTVIWEYATKWFSGEPDRRYGQPSGWLQGRRVQFGLRALF